MTKKDRALYEAFSVATSLIIGIGVGWQQEKISDKGLAIIGGSLAVGLIVATVIHHKVKATDEATTDNDNTIKTVTT